MYINATNNVTLTNITSNTTTVTGYGSLQLSSCTGALTINGVASTGSFSDALSIKSGSFTTVSISNVTSTSAGQDGIDFNGNSVSGSINISNATITSSGDYGLYLYNTTGSPAVTLTNVSSNSSGWNGLNIGSSTLGAISITNPVISSALGTSNNGVGFSMSAVTATSLTISHPTITLSNMYGIYLDDVIASSVQLLDGAIYNNVDTGVYLNQVPGAVISGSNPTSITNGGIWGNGNSGISVLASNGNSNNMVFENNWIYDNGNPYYNDLGNHDGIDIHANCSNETVMNNVVADNGDAGFAFVLNSSGVIYNNTIARNGTMGYTVRGGFYNSGTGSWTLENNILMNNYPNEYTVDSFALPPVTISNDNLFFHNRDANSLFYNDSSATYYNLAQWQTAFSQDLNSLNANPSFVNSSTAYSSFSDFYLQSSSPAIDAGTPIAGITNDILGNPIYGTPDIGAYEYQPPYTLATTTPNPIDIGAGARIYGDGSFRYLGTTSGVTAHLDVTPQSGNFLAYATTTPRPAWLDITNIVNWTNSHKTWTESNAATSSMVTDHTVGDLDNNTYYTITITNASSSNISGINGTSCNVVNGNAICESNSGGTLSFQYNGGYSTHTFDMSEDANDASLSALTVSAGTLFPPTPMAIRRSQ